MSRPSSFVRRGLAGLGLAFVTLALPSLSAAESRLMRQPDIHGSTIVFVYGGDLWTVERTGGTARRLTTDVGIEQYPAFAPDGRSVAFTAEYDGNPDLFVIPASGGEARRITWHPDGDRVAAWYPDGRDLLIRTGRTNSTYRLSTFHRQPADGGFAVPVPPPVAGPACFSPDGRRLAFNSPTTETRTWKRYKGGLAADVYIYDFATNGTEKITDWVGSDEFPMWFNDTIYFGSDRVGGRMNLWAYDLKTKATRQVTKFDTYDVKFPSIGPDAIVFENGGALYVLDLPSEKLTPIVVDVPSDRAATRGEYRAVADAVQGFSLSPSAKRVAVEARGDIFTVPAKKGTFRNLTDSPGVREKDPSWSPDGRTVAYWSDRTGEYELYLRNQDGSGVERKVTSLGAGYRFDIAWSPDSKRLAWSDQTGTLYHAAVADGRPVRVAKGEEGDIREYAWSPDSKWMAYTTFGSNGYGSIHLYDVKSGRSTWVSGGTTPDSDPTFDPEGKYLYFASARHFAPRLGGFDDGTWIFPNPVGLFAVTLAADGASPVQPESDEETGAEAGESGDGKGDGAGKGAKGGKGGKEKDAAAEDAVKPVTVDLEGISDRVVELPVDPGEYFALRGAGGKLFFLARDAAAVPGEDGPTGADLKFYDLKERETKDVISGLRGYDLSGDGSKLLVLPAAGGAAIVDAAPDQKADEKLALDALRAFVNPMAEWKQMFAEGWRLERDFFYDPGMHGLDWQEMRRRYEPLVAHAAHRADLNYVIGELISELNCSHAYVGGGEYPDVPHVSVGLLGAAYTLDAASGRYRFQKIYRKSEWNEDVVAPLAAPGIRVAEGDYLLRVDGRDLRAPEDVYAAFVGTARRPTTITVNSRPDTTGARTYTVTPLANDYELRYLDWVEGNRKAVSDATGGRVGYMHVPDTAFRGIVEFSRAFYAQNGKDGLIVDGRYNSGGFIPSGMVEMLARKPLSRWARREYRDFKTPSAGIHGPKVCLTNEYAGSGGDALPYYFRIHGLGPIIGRRSWGGLVGISRDLSLIDGGSVTMPDFGMFNLKGEWDVENHGIDPDIEVFQDFGAVVGGRDPQLEKAIEVIREQLSRMPPPAKQPAFPDRSK